MAPPQQQQVKSQGETVSHLKPGGFIGSLAFNRFIQEPVVVESTSTAKATDTDIVQPEFVYVEGSILEDGSSIYGDGDGRSTRQIVKGAFLHLMRQDHIIGKVAKSLVSDVMGMRVDADEMERCKTTVTATSDVSFWCFFFFLAVEFVVCFVCCFCFCRCCCT